MAHFVLKQIPKKSKKVQERALRFVYMIIIFLTVIFCLKAKLPTLHIRRMRVVAIETFKIFHDMAPPVLTDLIHKRENKYSFRYSNIFKYTTGELNQIRQELLQICSASFMELPS